MSFTIIANNLVGAVRLKRDNPEGALKKARELQREQHWDVLIAEDSGEAVLTEAAFAQRYRLE